MNDAAGNVYVGLTDCPCGGFYTAWEGSYEAHIQTKHHREYQGDKQMKFLNSKDENENPSGGSVECPSCLQPKGVEVEE